MALLIAGRLQRCMNIAGPDSKHGRRFALAAKGPRMQRRILGGECDSSVRSASQAISWMCSSLKCGSTEMRRPQVGGAVDSLVGLSGRPISMKRASLRATTRT